MIRLFLYNIIANLINKFSLFLMNLNSLMKWSFDHEVIHSCLFHLFILHTVALVVGANDIPWLDEHGVLASMETLCQINP